MVEKRKSILWLTADYFIDVDRQLVPYLREHSEYNIRWVVIQTLNGARVCQHDDYEILSLKYRGKDLRTYFQARSFIRTILKEQNFDFIYADTLGDMFYPALLHSKGEIVLIHAAHNVIPYAGWPWDLKLLVKYIFKKCSNFQIFSLHTAKWFKEQYPDKSFFYASMVVKDFGNVRTDRYQIDSSKVNLLFFGNIVENKRLDLLIDAIKQLPKEIQSRLHLNICGKCRLNQDEFINKIGDCKCISTYFKRIPDEDIPELFTKHQFLMLPYQNVAQSGPHMIAYNYNLPVIASDISGFAERVEDGKNGYLFKQNDVEALKEAIIKAVSLNKNAYDEMKCFLKQYVDSNFTLEAVSQKYIDFFDSLKR